MSRRQRGRRNRIRPIPRSRKGGEGRGRRRQGGGEEEERDDDGLVEGKP